MDIAFVGRGGRGEEEEEEGERKGEKRERREMKERAKGRRKSEEGKVKVRGNTEANVQ